ncbi:S24/S26 family peptidase [Deinococcus soli (ex Cha et al. 2016)]|uniref:Peptidase S24/S26A/S26B/S26C domain-containing protein n=1 Tax=Deinococcus soli (ex Cha et al. 2016) TaxID=1309411 RepID=A0AAE3XFA5_9DEIO|nr:S24/S26 family peptidase [Deinococcus soli (ex Cha et al. 2016)]MDR6219040.1 hypothetical protein [Deinococcus soli (ex Cha et al. 2016)]MDR6328837.1 hypothetical protein [Deinococcus soli (ex Cha et al. 2016)]
MGWADRWIQRLLAGETVSFRPRGHSMTPVVRDRQLVTVTPVTREPVRGDVVLCRVKGAQYLHLVKAVSQGRYLISRADGRENGWIGRAQVYGLLVSVSD